MLQGTQVVPVRAVRRWPVRERALGLGLLAALVASQGRALVGLVALWNTSPMYSYGFTVPVISTFLLWTRRAQLATLSPAPARLPGTALLIVSVLMLLTGRFAGLLVIEQLAFPVSILAAMLLVLGRAYVRIAWPALAYLLLMIPIWDGLTERLHEPFQLRSAAIGIAVLHALGIPAFREGTIIALPKLTIEVARACSGVNYLIAVVALGLPLAYLYLPGIWRRVLLIGSAILIAGFSNGLRVALIGVLAYFDVGAPLHGPFHVLHGLFVSAVGYLMLLGGLWLMMPSRSAPVSAIPPAPARPLRLPRNELSLAAAGLVTIALLSSLRYSTDVPLDRGLENLPASLGQWRSEPLARRAYEDLWPNADAALSRRYRRAEGGAVDLYVAYFRSQSDDRELVTFRTAGLRRRAKPVRVRDGSRWLVMNVVEGPSGEIAALFWYEIAGRVESRSLNTKLSTLWSNLRTGRSNGFAVLLAPIVPGSSSSADVQQFAALVHHALEAHVRWN